MPSYLGPWTLQVRRLRHQWRMLGKFRIEAVRMCVQSNGILLVFWMSPKVVRQTLVSVLGCWSVGGLLFSILNR